MDARIKLISSAYENDQYGVSRKTESERTIFADVRTVTQTEWFEGGRSGLNPQFKMIMFAPEYKGEQVVEYGGNRYLVYRTYQPNPDKLELYVQKEAGVHG